MAPFVAASFMASSMDDDMGAPMNSMDESMD